MVGVEWGKRGVATSVEEKEDGGFFPPVFHSFWLLFSSLIPEKTPRKSFLSSTVVSSVLVSSSLGILQILLSSFSSRREKIKQLT